MTTFLRNLITDESGATAIEYGLIAALIAVGLVGALNLLGNELGSTFNEVGNTLNSNT